MLLIQLRTNDTKSKKIDLIVTEKQFKVIEELQTLGGFLRYQIDIYDDTIKKGKLDILAFNQFMIEVFNSAQIVNYFFKPVTKQNYWFDYLAK
jgi:uroporphyrinogen-III synthase